MIQADFYIIQVERDALEHKDPEWQKHLGETILAFRILARTKSKQCCAFLFHGYDDDPREVWQIRECRAFCKRVMEQVPEYYHIADNLTRSVLLHATAVKKDDGWHVNAGWQHVEPKWRHIQLTSMERGMK